VQVGAADGGGGILDEDAAGLDLRRRQRLQLERLSGLHEKAVNPLGTVSSPHG